MSDSAKLAVIEAELSGTGSTDNSPPAIQTPVERYRTWVTNHTVGGALLAGFVAVQIATVVGFWLPAIGLPKLDWNSTNGAIFTPKSSADVQFASGAVYHYLDGFAFAIMFAVAIFPYLRWATTPLGNILKGLAFGTALAIVSCAIMIPLVYYPAYHPGFFSLNLGWKLVLAVFVWHWVFGLHLGILYNPNAVYRRKTRDTAGQK